MSDSNNHSNSSASNTSNATGRQATSPPENPLVTSSTQSNHSASSIGTYVVNRGLVNGNHQAQRTTPTDSNINSDRQARDNALNDQDDTLPSAVETVDFTDDPTVRRLHEAFHPDALQRPRGPLIRASSIARQMTARDRQELGIQSDTSQPESASNNNQSTTSEPDGFNLFETPSSKTPPVAVTDTPVTLGVSRDDYFSLSGALQSDPPQANSSGADCTHRQAENSNGEVIENGRGRAQASPGTPMNTPTSVNVSELRLGPVSRESHTELALFSQYSEDEPSRAAPDEYTTATSSTTPVRRHGPVARYHPDERASNTDPVHGSTPDNSTRDSTPRDDGVQHA